MGTKGSASPKLDINVQFKKVRLESLFEQFGRPDGFKTDTMSVLGFPPELGLPIDLLGLPFDAVPISLLGPSVVGFDLPDNLPPGTPKARTRLCLQGIGHHPLAPHLLPNPPAPTVKERTGVFGGVIQDTNPGYLKSKSIHQGSGDWITADSYAHQTPIILGTYGELGSLRPLVVPVIQVYKLLGLSNTDWNYGKCHLVNRLA